MAVLAPRDHPLSARQVSVESPQARSASRSRLQKSYLTRFPLTLRNLASAQLCSANLTKSSCNDDGCRSLKCRGALLPRGDENARSTARGNRCDSPKLCRLCTDGEQFEPDRRIE